MKEGLTCIEERPAPRNRLDVSRLGLWLVLFLAVALRVSHLQARNLWFDEAWSWSISRYPLRVILQEGQSNIHPPLWHLVLKFWTELFGSSLVVLRLPSLVASVGIVAGAYEMGRHVHSRQAGLLAALFLALSPHQIFYAQEARMYALVTVLTLGAVLAFIGLLRQEGLLVPEFEAPDGKKTLGIPVATPPQAQARRAVRGAVGYVLSAALALYTHVFGALVLLAVNLHFLGLLLYRRRRKELVTSAGRLARRWGVWQLGLALLYAPWASTFVYQVLSRPRQEWRPPLRVSDLFQELLLFCGKVSVGPFVYPQGFFYALRNLVEYRWNTDMLLRALENASLYPLAIGVGVFFLWKGARAARAGLVQALFFLPVMVICALLFVIRQYMDFGRYLTMITPYYFLLLAVGITTLQGARKQGVAIGLVILPMILGLKAHYRAALFDSDYRPVAAVLKEHWRQGDHILVDPAYMDRCIRYEVRTTPILDALPPVDLPPTPLPDQLAQVRGARVWVVLDYRSPWFSASEALDAACRAARWQVVTDQKFPSSDPRIRLLLFERPAP
jgi:uncharacterized membrane protein